MENSNNIKLEIGSGRAKLEGYITIDKDPLVGADICLDIEKTSEPEIALKIQEFLKGKDPMGWENKGVDEIRAHHILEHLKPENKVKMMALFNYLLEVGGILDIEVPLFPHPASVQDPTHISFWCAESFKYFIKGDPFGEAFAKRHSEYPVPLFEKVEDYYIVSGKGKMGYPAGEALKDVWAYGIKLKKI